MGDILNLRRAMPRMRRAAPLPNPRTLSASGSFDALALLLAETAAGREAAFARLYELTAGRLLAIARSIVGGRGDVAEDVLQELVRPRLAVGASIRSRQGHGLLLAGADRAQPRADGARSPSSPRGRSRRDSKATRSPRRMFDPADQAMRSEDARRVHACLADLPANHRRALMLVYFEGLTHSELAQRLDVQLGTAKSWVRRGLAQMNRCLTGGTDAGWRELVAAEYAIGGLHGAVQRGFERRRARDARYCRAVDQWEHRFALLAELLAPAPLRPQVWKNIELQIARGRVAFKRPWFWRTAASVLAVGIVLLAIVLLR